jgi:HSP20 family protein
MNITLFNKNNKLTSSLFDEFLNDTFVRFPTSKFANSTVPAVNIAEKENETHLQVMLPGIDKADIKLSVDNNVLTISHEKNHEEDKSTQNFIHREFEHTAFTRSFRLPQDSDSEKIESKMENGILTIKIPKDTTKVKKLIEIQ